MQAPISLQIPEVCTTGNFVNDVWIFLLVYNIERRISLESSVNSFLVFYHYFFQCLCFIVLFPIFFLHLAFVYSAVLCVYLRVCVSLTILAYSLRSVRRFMTPKAIHNQDTQASGEQIF